MEIESKKRGGKRSHDLTKDMSRKGERVDKRDLRISRYNSFGKITLQKTSSVYWKNNDLNYCLGVKTLIKLIVVVNSFN